MNQWIGIEAHEKSTIDENGFTNIGSYSLYFPYYIAGKEYYAMILECRNSSNTCKNLLKTGKCALNFLQDDRKYFKEAVRLGFPGETPEEKMKDCLYTLVVGYPRVPVDYGYRDSKNFWYTKFRRPIAMPIPKNKGVDIDSVKYAAGRIDPDVKFTEEACKTLLKVPRPFLNTVLKGCVKWAKENNVTLITPKEMQIINDKRSKEKNK